VSTPFADASVEVKAEFDPNIPAQSRREGERAGQAYEQGLQRGVADAGSRVSRDINGRLRDERGKFVAEGEGAGGSFGSGFQRGLRRSLSSGALRGIFRGSIIALGVSLLGAAAAAAAANVVQLTAALAPLSGLLLLLPAAGAVAAAAITTLLVAFSGVGDALGAALEGDLDAFNKALERLSPNARVVARDFLAIVPSLRAIKTQVQDAFFGPLQGQLQQVARTLEGPLRNGLSGIAAEFGNAGRGLAQFAREAATVRVLDQVFAATRQSVAAFNPALAALSAGFRDAIGAVVPIFVQINGSIARSLVVFGQWLTQISASGQAFAWVPQALVTLRQFGDLFLQIGGIIGAVLGSAQASGQGLLVTLTELLRGVNAFLSSAEGQTALTGAFTLLAQIGAGLGPVITTLIRELSSLFPIIGRIVEFLGPTLQTALQGLGAGLRALGDGGLVVFFERLQQAIAILAPSLTPVGAALGALFAGIAPLLPAVTQVVAVILQLAAALVQQLLPVLQPVIDALSDQLLTVLPQITPSLLDLVVAVGQLVQLLIPVLVPLLQFVVFLERLVVAEAVVPALNAFATAVRFINSVITGAVSGIGDFVGWLGELASAAGSGLTTALTAVGDFFASIGTSISGGFTSALTAVGDFFTNLGNAFLALPGLIGRGLAALPGLLASGFKAAFDAVLFVIGAGIGLILFAILELPGLIGDGLSALGDILASAFDAAVAFGAEALRVGLAAIVFVFTDLPVLIGQALVNLGAAIGDAFNTAVSAATSFVVSGIASLVALWDSLPGRIGAGLAALGAIIGGAFTSARDAAVRIAVDLANTVVSFISSIPGRIGALAGQMFAAGQSLINSLFNGLKAVGGFASDIASRVVAGIRGALNSVIDGLNSGIRGVWPGAFGSPPQIPRLARGAIIDRETLAVLGEAGREVVIPLTKPDRAVELARQSGLVDLLMQRGALTGPTTAGVSKTVHVSAPITVNTQVRNPELVALRAADHVFALAQA
jgi:phage-related protein